MSESNLVVLDDFAVVASSDGHVWIIDGDGNGWNVGEVDERIPDDNKLAAAVRDAFDE